MVPGWFSGMVYIDYFWLSLSFGKRGVAVPAILEEVLSSNPVILVPVGIL